MVVDQWLPPNAPQYHAPFEHPLENYGPTLRKDREQRIPLQRNNRALRLR
jgi:hypothetical protein